MKKLFIVFAALTLTAGAFGQISSTAHDFSSAGWNSSGEICIACHTPHNADMSVAGSPLWNHEVTAATFDLYTYTTSSTLNAADIGQPDGVSKLCLSCHDGTVALDSFGGATGSTLITGFGLIGTTLTDDHPISFTYDTALVNADGDLAEPTSAPSGLGGTINADLLFSSKVECASCHDVHNGGEDPGTKLLVKSNAGSALCLTCHTK